MSILAPHLNLGSFLFTSLDRAVEAFRQGLEALGYNPTAVEEATAAIRQHQETATLVETGLLDAEDEAMMEQIFSDSFDAVHSRSSAWDMPAGFWTPGVDEFEPDVEEAELSEIGFRAGYCEA